MEKSMTNKLKYKNFCEKEKNITIFSKDWWLDSVCGKNGWDVVLVENDQEIIASFPYYKTKKFFIFNSINMPPLTQTMGVYIKYPSEQKYNNKLSFEKKMMHKLIEGLPTVDLFSQNFDKSITNWLPFYWRGFEQTTRYTYRIKDMPIEELEKALGNDIRRRRKKCLEAGVEVYESDDLKQFYSLNEMTFKRQGLNTPYTFGFIENLYNKCKENNSVKIYFAKDKNGVNIATNFLVYDENTVYNLMSGIDTERKDLGGMDLVLFESIKFALDKGCIFDFEGSMIESIETYYRNFGAIQKPYSNISKKYSRLFKILYFLRSLLKG